MLVQSALLGYRLLLRNVTDGDVEKIAASIPSDDTEYTIDGLEPSHVYDVTIEANIEAANPIRTQKLTGGPAKPPMPVYIEV